MVGACADRVEKTGLSSKECVSFVNRSGDEMEQRTVGRELKKSKGFCSGELMQRSVLVETS